MVERGKAPPKLGVPNSGRSGNRVVEATPATGNNRNQDKCLGTKPGAFESAGSLGLRALIVSVKPGYLLLR